MRSNLSFLLLLLSLVSATAVLAAAAATDPELKQCKHQCRVQQQFDEKQKRECIQECQSYMEEKEKREGGESKKGGEESEGRNPYVFEEGQFSTILKSEHGKIEVLPRFSEWSELLKGIDNYRLVVLEADPQTFVLPKHTDADVVLFVLQGKGSISMVRQNKREGLNIRRGDIVVVPAGTTEYVINRDNNEKLIVGSLLRPVNVPGQFQSFFGAAGEVPESYYRAFTDEILEAALNIKKEKYQRIFGQQKQGAIVKASEEQIRELSQQEEGGIWPFGEEHKRKINIFKQRPTHSNQYGQHFEVSGSDIRHLQDLDVAVSATNISKGSMTALVYNSRATKIAIVSSGEGYLEMACPHLSQSQEGQSQSQSQQEQEGQQGSSEKQQERKDRPAYQKVSARLRYGVIVVIPPGHPYVAIASENKNLEMVCFEINANNNEKFTLAGKSNVMSKLEKVAQELAFGVPASEVEEVFKSQKDDFFFKGPSQRQQRGQHEGRADE